MNCSRMTYRFLQGLLVSTCVLAAASGSVRAQLLTAEQARTVAENWVQLQTHNMGDWGGSAQAEVTRVEEIARDDRRVGYLAHVRPTGYVVVPVLRGLCPVKAYSTSSGLSLNHEDGMAVLLATKLDEILRAVEDRMGPLDRVRSADIKQLTDEDYADAWQALLDDPSSFRSQLAGGLRTDYQHSHVLVKSHWHQHAPYWNQCPEPGPLDNCDLAHCLVGCVATAGAQIMRYWHWPPRGVGEPYYEDYDWELMPWRIVWDTANSQWVDSPFNNPLSNDQIDAIARINREVGMAVDMDYCGDLIIGSCASSAYTHHMEGVFEDIFRYNSSSHPIYRIDYSTSDWWGAMKYEFNCNRPVQYRIYGHSLIADGWRLYWIGETSIRQFHMNYGWGELHENEDGCDTWYNIDELYYPVGGSTDHEYAVINIRPNVSFNGWISGYYSKPTSFPYRYVDRDANSDGGFFEAGQLFQFLPGTSIKCSSTDSTLQFEGIGANISNCRMYSRIDRTRGVRIYRGKLQLRAGGGIKLYGYE